MPALVAALGDDAMPAAEAIRTTDLRTKVAFREIDVGGKAVQFAAIAKGSGMIHPNMATMLCFITTDATIAPAVLQAALAEAVEDTFNTITVDGDMSTNDTVIALANGRVGRAGDRARQRRTSRSCRRRWSACAPSSRAPSPPTARAPRKLLIVDVAGAPERADGPRSGPRGRRRQPGEVRHLRRRSVVGPHPGGAGRARRRPQPRRRSGAA